MKKITTTIKCTKCRARKCPTEYGEAKVIDVIMEMNGCEFSGNCFSWIFKDKKTGLDKMIKKIENTPIEIYDFGGDGWHMSHFGNDMFDNLMNEVKLHNEEITGIKDIICV